MNNILIDKTENKNTKKAVKISHEEMDKQRDFTARIKARNSQKNKDLYAFVETYGCQQNESDSEKIRGMLSDMGYIMTHDIEKADFILYNTCAVRENAELKVFGNIGALKHKKNKNPEMIVGVCGCMMQQEHIAKTIKSKYRHVDMVFGTHALYRFPQILCDVMEHQRVFDIKNEDGSIFEDINVKRNDPPTANIPIMYGCNNFCTYCIVPYVRGRERSRNSEDILSECREVASKGYKEIVLLGQNVNSYSNDLSGGIRFHELLSEACRIDGIERIRFITSHPKDISDELIEVMAKEPKICKQLHMPIQAGSNRVLALMNRKYTREEYLERLKKVRTAMPDIVLTTDIIVGFPGETNEDFQETIEVLRDVEYDMIYSFIYSKRKGTPAAEMPDCLSDQEKHKNFDDMLSVQNEISRRKNEKYLSRTVAVLVEGISKTNSDALSGRTDGGKIVNFSFDSSEKTAQDIIGSIVDVKINNTRTWSLFGDLV